MTYYIVVLMLLMGLSLFMAARYDANGAEVPDIFTATYAVLGIAAAINYDRISTATVCLIFLILVLQPWRPKWIYKLNDKIIARHYSEEKLSEELTELDAKAKAFDQKMSKDYKAYWIALAIYLIALYPARRCVLHFAHNTKVEIIQDVAGMIGIIFFIVLMTTLLFLLFSTLFTMKRQNKGECEEEPLPMTAIGGADIIVFIGLIAFYGPLAGTYLLIPSLVVYLLWFVISRKLKKQDLKGGEPLLPIILITAPMRIILAYCIF